MRRSLRAKALRVAATFALLAAAGCQTLDIEVSDATHARVVRQQKSFFLAGLFPRDKRVDVSQFCPDGVSRMREQTTGAEVLVSLLSVGLWTPRSTWYYCLPGTGEGDDFIIELPIPAPDEEGEAEGTGSAR